MTTAAGDPVEAVSAWIEVQAFINDRIPDGPFIIGEWSVKIVAEMGEVMPSVLADWQDDLARHQVEHYLGSHLRSRRTSVFRRVRRAENQAKFDEALETGKYPLFSQTIHVGDLVHKPLGLITRQDAKFLANEYGKTARHAILEQKFWQQIDKKITGGRMLLDVMSEETFVRIYRSLTGTDFGTT